MFRRSESEWAKGGARGGSLINFQTIHVNSKEDFSMLSALGTSLLIGSTSVYTWPAAKKLYERQMLSIRLRKVFKYAEIYRKGKKNSVDLYPVVERISLKDSKSIIYFTLPVGVDPELLEKKKYVFSQEFGKNIQLEADVKVCSLSIFRHQFSKWIKYDYEQFRESIDSKSLPVIAGVNRNGELITYDMVQDSKANLIIIGEPGAGKSTQLRQILTTWIQFLPRDRLKMYLADLKRSEFYLFRNIENISVTTSEEELMPDLYELMKEVEKRGKLLDKHEVSHIDDLPVKLPYIVLCIDEFSLLAHNKDILGMLQRITSLGRALGIQCIISMQRASYDLIPTFVRSNMNVAMGFRVIDSSNANMVGTPGAEKITIAGRMICKLEGLNELQAPFLDIGPAKAILKDYKTHNYPKKQKPLRRAVNEFNDVFGVLDK